MSTPLQQIDIVIKQRHLLQFDNLQKDPTASTATETSIALSHDLEKTGDDIWLVHIDVWLTVPGIASVLNRIVYEIACKEDVVWAEGVSREYIKPALQLCRESFNTGCKNGNIDASLPESFVNEDRVIECHELLMDGVNSMEEANKKDPILPSDFLFITPGKKTNMVASCTLIILDQIMFLNPCYKRMQNRKVLQQFIPLQYYFTVKNKLISMTRDGVKTGLSVQQFLIYTWMVQCALSLLLSHHGDLLSEEIAKAGLTEELKDNYITSAISSLKEISSMLGEGGVTITNLQEKNDWVEMIG